MKRSLLHEWLRRHFRSQKIWCLAGAFFVILVGCVVMLLVNWVIGLLVPPLIAILILALLFWCAAFFGQDYFERRTFEISDRERVHIRSSLSAANSVVLAFMGADTGNPIADWVARFLLLGPRSILTGLILVQRARELDAIDYNRCGRILLYLLTEDKKISFVDLAAKFPSMEHSLAFSELTMVEGMLLMAGDPPGLSVTPVLVEELVAWEQRTRGTEG